MQDNSIYKVTTQNKLCYSANVHVCAREISEQPTDWKQCKYMMLVGL